MRTLFQNRRHLRLIIFGALFLSLLVTPVAAHAAFFDLAAVGLNAVLDGVLSVVTLVNSLLGQLLNMAKEALLFALTLSLEAVLGLTVIDVAWKVMRDMANFVFILMLVVISFSTILSVIPQLKGFHYKSALKNVVIAALLMNFSLAIGQTIVLASDQVAQIFIKIMPDLGKSLVASLPVQSVVLDPKALTGPLPANEAAGIDVLKGLTDAEDKRYKECLKEEKTRPADLDFGFYKFALGLDAPSYKFAGECMLEAMAARQGVWKVSTGQPVTPEQAAAVAKLKASTPSDDVQQRIFLIFSGLLSGFLIFIVTLCLITPFFFILFRVLALWVLLFSSPIAWASFAVPGSKWFGEWWRYFIGWNAFAPVYLFVLIPGMIVLQSSGEMLTALSNAGGNIGTAGGLFEIFMFHAFAVLIFLGGLYVAMTGSFAGAVKATPILGGWADKTFGISDKFGLGGARLIGRNTGISASLQARKEQIEQKAGEIRRRLPLKTYDQRLESERLRLGLIGGKEASDLRAKPIKEEGERITKAMFGMDKLKKEDYLKKRMNSSDKTIKLAAREEMLKMGLLSDAQIEETADLYGAKDSPARKAFDDRVRRAPGAAAIEKKKEEETKRAEFIATVRDKVKTPADVASQLDPVFAQIADPSVPPEKKSALRKDLKAAEEAIGGKDPLLLKDYLDARGEPNSESRAFAPVLKDSTRIMELSDDYLTPGNAKMVSLKTAIDNTYRNPPDKAKLRERLLRADPTRTNEIYDLTS